MSKVEITGGVWYEQKSGHDNYRHPHEKMDCTVRAISAAFDIPYKDAHRHCKDFYNRKDGRGFPFVRTFGKHTRMLFWKTVTYFPRPKMTLGTFVKKNPTGTFMVLVPKHILTVKDGVMIDLEPYALGTRVKEYYKVEGGNNG